ncbi:MAG: hypothetical protein QXG10_05115 [Candidatus Hadarchaeales archaeon]
MLVIVALIVLLLMLAVLLSLLITFLWGAPWSPTPMKTVRRMLEMADLKEGERIYDLGSGDGRIAITAYREFGARPTGVEINPFLHLLATIRGKAQGCGRNVDLVCGNLLDVDLSDADVVAAYLSPWGNRKLKEKLERELRRGTRVVTHKWKFDGWKPVKVDEEHGIWVYESGRW